MGYNRFTKIVSIRVVLILCTMVVLVLIKDLPNRVATSIFLGLLVIYQVYSLIRFCTQINKEFSRFLVALKEGDTTNLYLPDRLKKNFQSIEYSFQQISDELRKSRLDSESKEQFLQIIIENLNDGLIAFTEDGKISVINPAAKNLLDIKQLSNIWDLDRNYKDLAKTLVYAGPGSPKLIRIKVQNEIRDLLFRISEVVIAGDVVKVVTFQDFKRELEEKELASWKKLIRVLTHEIMNSITPITTLSVAVRRIIKPEDTIKDINNLHQDDLEDIFINNTVIEERSKGLLQFMEQYRKLTKMPALRFEYVNIKSLIEEQRSLFKKIIDENQIDFTIDVEPEDLSATIDRKLTEQVLINLIKNAIEALDKQTKKIEISAGSEDEYVFIRIADNGKGISHEIQDQVFVPFFTTKENGSGIGLSLCKEIMMSMKGSIHFESADGKGSTFWLKFY